MTANEIRYDPLDPDVRENPYPHYARLRREAPVFRVESRGLYAVSRYADVVHVLRRHDLFSSAAMAAALRQPVAYVPEEEREPPSETAALGVIGADPPEHTRLRAVLNRGFTPRRIAALEPRIRAIAKDLTQALRGREQWDFVAEFAVPLPVAVIAELLGVPTDRLLDFKRWSDAAVRAAFVAPAGDDESREIGRALREMGDYFEPVLAARRADPRADLISALVRAEAVEGTLSEPEARIFLFTLLVAGNITTTQLLANSLLALLRHPEQLARLRADPGRIPAMVEESLRYDAPVQLLLRTAVHDVELAGTRIPAGAPVLPLFASANRDETVFPDPDRFDVDRDPRDHLAFGHGIHYCLGAHLARLEARIAFQVLFEELPPLELLEERIRWVPALVLRGPERLRVGIGAARAG
jgi:cytochrome P450